MAAKVLLIDDNANLLKLIGIILRQSGYEVMVSHSGKLGVSMAESEQPDLILLDVMMPDMNGYEVCRQLRANPELAKTRIILFSAMSRRRDKETGFEAGADDYLIKPIHPVELVNKVREVLARPFEDPKSTEVTSPVAPMVSPLNGTANGNGVSVNLTGSAH